MRTFCVLHVTILSLCSGIYGINVDGEIVEKGITIYGPRNYFGAEELEITTDDVTVTTINGREASYYQNEKIISLVFLGQTVNYLPKGFENFFPLLEKLGIGRTGLKSIKSDDLKPFVHLRIVALNYNNITTLDSNLFDFNPEIITLSITGNNLKHIGADILTPLKKLSVADFSSNECVDKLISKGGSETADFSALVSEFKARCV